MKYATSCIVIVLMYLCCAYPAFALSDSDYQRYMQESPSFVQAEKKLADTWKSIKNANNGRIPSALMTEQKRWIQKERDSEAKALFNKMSSADAYAEVTIQRIQVLESMWLRERPTHSGDTSAADISGTYTYEYKDIKAGGQITITSKGGSEYFVEVIINDGTGRPESSSEFRGIGRIEDGVLVVANQEKIQDSEWVNGKRIEKSTATIVSGVLKVYLKPHPDFQASALDKEFLRELSAMKGSQIAVIEDPVITGGDDLPRMTEYYRLGTPPFYGIYTKSAPLWQ